MRLQAIQATSPRTFFAPSKSAFVSLQPADRVEFAGRATLTPKEEAFNANWDTMFLGTQPNPDAGWAEPLDDEIRQTKFELEKRLNRKVSKAEATYVAREMRLERYGSHWLSQNDHDRMRKYGNQFKKGDYSNLGNAIAFRHYNSRIFKKKSGPTIAMKQGHKAFHTQLVSLVQEFSETPSRMPVLLTAGNQLDSYIQVFRQRVADPKRLKTLTGLEATRDILWSAYEQKEKRLKQTAKAKNGSAYKAWMDLLDLREALIDQNHLGKGLDLAAFELANTRQPETAAGFVRLHRTA